MTYTRFLLLLFSLAFLLSCSKDDGVTDGDSNGSAIINEPFTEDKATYRVTFNIDWNQTDYPSNFPSNAHFSRLIGWSHQPNHSFFEVGSTASEGIKDMAELGSNSNLSDEIAALIKAGEGLDFILGNNLSTGVGVISVDVEVSTKYASITLASMIAPSPDWYVAVVDIELYKDGGFVSSMVVDGLSYDAGTDSGQDYTSANNETNPRETIELLSYKEITPFTPIAKVTFTKL